MRYGWSKVKSRVKALSKKYSCFEDVPHTLTNGYIDGLTAKVKHLSYSENYKKLRGFIQVELNNIYGNIDDVEGRINVVWIMSYLYWLRNGEDYILRVQDLAYISYSKTRRVIDYVMPTREKLCTWCNSGIYFDNRMFRKQYLDNEHNDLCPDCMKRAYDSGEIDKLPYRVYLMTNHWHNTREAAISRAGGACVVCGNVTGLQVHHRNYERIGNELDSDLVVLCKNCHKKIHKK